MWKNIKNMSCYVNVSKLLLRMVALIYGTMIFYVLVVCLLFQHTTYMTKANFLCSNIILLLIGGVLLFCIYRFISKRHDILENKYLIWILSFFAFCLQVFAIYNYYFYTDWDSKIITNAAFQIANNGNIGDGYNPYFSMYPNNLLLVVIYALIVKICNILNIGCYAYFLLLVFQSMIFILSGILLFYTVFNIKKNKKFAYCGWIFYLILVLGSPWVSIPYSDSVGIIFPIFIMWILTFPLKSLKIYLTGIKAFVIVTCLVIGYHIKPQILNLLIAIIIIYGIWSCQKLRVNSKYILSSVIGGVIGIICVSTVYMGMQKSMFPNLDREKEFGITHFLMMGLNETSMGVYNGKDVEYSASFDNKEERNEKNIEMAKKRLHQMGVNNLFLHLNRKLLIDYNDGTFAWGKEGVFFCKFAPAPDNHLAPLLRNIYYENGKYFGLFCTFEQMIWIIVLFLSIFSILGEKSNQIFIAMLSIIGLTIFELIFEARARYLFVYVPIYIVLAVIGFEQLILYLKKYRERSENEI